MRANLDLTGGLIFADAVSARLAEKLGRAAAHAVVERAADEVRATGRPLQAVLAEDGSLPEELRSELGGGFDLARRSLPPPALQTAPSLRPTASARYLRKGNADHAACQSQWR